MVNGNLMKGKSRKLFKQMKIRVSEIIKLFIHDRRHVVCACVLNIHFSLT